MLTPVKDNQIESLCTLINAAYRGDSSRQGWTTEADLLDGQRTDPQTLRELLSQGSVILLLQDSETILGCVYLKKEGQSAYLGMLTISPALQNQGLGKQLLFGAEDYARSIWKCTKVRMTVITLRESLLAWYERHGYARTGKFENFPYGDARFGIPRRADLIFCVLEKAL